AAAVRANCPWLAHTQHALEFPVGGEPQSRRAVGRMAADRCRVLQPGELLPPVLPVDAGATAGCIGRNWHRPLVDTSSEVFADTCPAAHCHLLRRPDLPDLHG